MGKEKFRKIQSVQRAFAVLEFLNLRNGATQRELCDETGLTRGTAYRMLETMRSDGFLRKDEGSARYWLTGRVRALADGYGEEWWVEQFARGLVQDLGRRIRWPVKLLTPSEHSMLVRVTTDYESPFTEAKFPSGHRIGMTSTAAGRAYLAACDPSTRDILIRADQKNPRAEVLKVLQRVRRQGYEIVEHRKLAIYTMSCPVTVGTQPVGALAVQIFRASVTQAQAVREFLPELVKTAREIGEKLT